MSRNSLQSSGERLNQRRTSATRIRGSATQSPASTHADRLKAEEKRLETFTQKSDKLANFLKSYVMQAFTSEEDATEPEYSYRLDPKIDEHISSCPVSAGNLPGYCRLLPGVHLVGTERRRVYARVIKLKSLPGDVAFCLSQTLAIGQFFGKESSHFLAVSSIFSIAREEVWLFQEPFSLADSLWHRSMEGQFEGVTPVKQIKQWIAQLASAVDYLTLHGVAHRFIRTETVLVGESANEKGDPTYTVKLTAFDNACLFWDAGKNHPIRSSKGLPLSLPPHLLDHLPPEAFTEATYDPSMVDSWSIGVLLFSLFTNNASPFVVTLDEKKDLVGPQIKQWKLFPRKGTIPDELRSLLDDIFTQADKRMTPADMTKDERLSVEMTSEKFQATKLRPYYRIDLKKKINLNYRSTSMVSKLAPREVSSIGVASTAVSILSRETGLKSVDSREAIAGYQIRPASSFHGDLSGEIFPIDGYLKAATPKENDACNCLVRIFLPTALPARVLTQLRVEACKIMRFMSEASRCAHVHRVLDLFRDAEKRIFVFYESLVGCRSLWNLVDEQLNKQRPSPGVGQDVTQENIHKWATQLAETVNTLAANLLAHRYIRPEFVHISESGDVRLSHFDMACFGWKAKKTVLRSRGLQDELEPLWDHLPPECFDTEYECLLVDVWSLAVLVIFCLLGETPFTVPMSNECALMQWRQWKEGPKGTLLRDRQLDSLIAVFDKVFVPAKTRINSQKLQALLTPSIFNVKPAEPSSAILTTRLPIKFRGLPMTEVKSKSNGMVPLGKSGERAASLTKSNGSDADRIEAKDTKEM